MFMPPRYHAVVSSSSSGACMQRHRPACSIGIPLASMNAPGSDGSGFVHGQPPLRPARPGPETSCHRGGASSRRPLSYPVRSPAWRPIRDPCPIRHGRDVPHGGTLSMRRRVSARLAFGHTPARPCGRKATPSSIRYTILLRERRRHSAGSASASIASAALPDGSRQSAALSDGSRQGDNAFRADRHRGVHRGRRRLIGRRSGGASRATPRRLRPAPRSRTAPAGGRRARVPGRHAPGPPLRPARRYPRPEGVDPDPAVFRVWRATVQLFG